MRGPLTGGPRAPDAANRDRHRPNGYLARRTPSLSLASSLRTCLICEVLEGIRPAGPADGDADKDKSSKSNSIL